MKKRRLKRILQHQQLPDEIFLRLWLFLPSPHEITWVYFGIVGGSFIAFILFEDVTDSIGAH